MTARLSLQGCRIVNTRPRGQNAKLSALLNERGAKVFELPVLTCSVRESVRVAEDLKESARLGDWLVLTSVNAVTGLETLQSLEPIRNMGAICKIAAVGEATRAALEERGFHVSLLPEEHTATGLCRALISDSRISSEARIFWLRGSAATNEVKEVLESSGHVVYDSVVYDAVPESYARETVATLLDFLQGEAECRAIIILTSPRGAEGLLTIVTPSLHAQSLSGFFDTQVVAVGSRTGDRARSLGFKAVFEAARSIDLGMVEACEEIAKRNFQ